MECVLCSLFQPSLSLPLCACVCVCAFFYCHSLAHTRRHTACTHRSKHIQSLLCLSQANTSRAALSPHKHAHTNTPAQWKSMVQSRRRPMKNACPFACFIRNTHRDSIHISAEEPHRNINYIGNLGGSVGRNDAEREYGIHSVVLMRGSLPPAAVGPTSLAQIVKYTLA